ncbi:MAG: hypothetical protein GF317_04285 [Candidatus Lokiarchaeota archaeon]|nr:hypothetical protein [Candidatus Lokiarchaeota archaeon]MBD3199107.1 hypothetical protein [Candidatus Lokiarchaeota archaeon]
MKLTILTIRSHFNTSTKSERYMIKNNDFEHIKVDYLKKEAKSDTFSEDIKGQYAIISLNRPEKLNAITLQTIREITLALDQMELDENIRCVILRGTKHFTKKPSFSTGADLSNPLDPSLKMNIPIHMTLAIHQLHKYFNLIEAFPKPLIAAVDGYALGGGCELALTCDIVIASKRSSFGFTEILRGIFPAGGGTQRMARHIGANQALKMLYFGKRYSADQMEKMGFVNYVIDDDDFEDFIHEKASFLSNAATTALIIIKKCLKFGTQVPPGIGLKLEPFGCGVNSATDDKKEGIEAFREKRTPKFKGI